ncbi:oligopeptide ABC transporter substrate-binding protein [Lactobacillus sp. ESL0731]|uniref:oligopeptide ABC transporter substrate-binding protein n=1 Tax=unclassified Lactobacillus TaxID=2620435 RepID=UPI0023F71EBC|nr:MULTISPECIES: oligopeptide ABC transporter substrate-binding protein [unclassified Lactobacillus]WEV50466.1 oligopeptide ABC transporter substrate-binding protein [Lactobacillus sp. ESL0700]WEV61596.1 oligopeptide ABC transporter substrate-binding protein [Lactobacillus sp. ESL0731]
MKKSKILSSIGVVTAAALTLVACGKSNNGGSNQNANSVDKFSASVPSKATKQGGTLKVAVRTDTPFTGIFSDELSTTSVDSEVSQPGEEELFDTDDTFKINDKGPATLKLNVKAKTATITVKKGVKWSDGKQVTAKDMEYSYEILANKKTAAQRYSSQLENIEGMKEYHNGQAKTISGIEMPDGENGRQIIIHFKQMKPGMTNSGNGYFWEYVAPYHYLKDVPFDKLQSSDKIRKHPLYFGPFKLAKLVRGESATWVPNKYYWRGTPKLNKIVISVISSNSTSQSIKDHKFDVIQAINTQWDQVKDTKNVNFVAQIPLQYNYIGFKVGKWDAKKGKNVMNPKAKMSNKALRQAIGYAMNVDAVDKRYTEGLSFRVPTLIPAQFGDYFDKNAKGYSYNLKKANAILDKAGYKKKGKWRVQPNGKPLVINYMARQGDSTQEPIEQNYIQQWHKIGLNVKLVGGRLTEFNSFQDKLQHDDPSVDMFEAGWSLASEPSPNIMYSETTPMNYSRFATPENNKLMDEIDSTKSFNHKYRVQKFHEWQEYMNDQAFIIPEDNKYQVYAVNDKITGYSLKPSQNTNGHQLWWQVGFIK